MNIVSAKNIPIEQYLAFKGYHPICQNNLREFWYLSPFRNEKTASFKVNLKLNTFYDFGIGEGGNIIDLSLRLGNVNVKNALHELSQVKSSFFSFQEQDDYNRIQERAQNDVKVIKVKKLENRALIQYAKSRGISEDVAKKYCIEIYYQIGSGKRYFSLGIKTDVGGFSVRNKYYKSAIAPCGFTSIINQNNCLSVFEGFFDFLSHRILFPDFESDYIILNSIIYINQAEEKFKNYQVVNLFLDNDNAGLLKQNLLCEKYKSLINNQSHLYKEFKDLNEFLMKEKVNN